MKQVLPGLLITLCLFAIATGIQSNDVHEHALGEEQADVPEEHKPEAEEAEAEAEAEAEVEENAKLKTENAKLRTENAKLHADNAKLQAKATTEKAKDAAKKVDKKKKTCTPVCTPECRTRHVKGIQKYPSCDLPAWSPLSGEALKDVMKYSTIASDEVKRTYGCATIHEDAGKPKLNHWHQQYQCTSCTSERPVFLPVGGVSMIGKCAVKETKQWTQCTDLNANSGASNGQLNSICLKYERRMEELMPRRGLKSRQDPAMYNFFKPIFGPTGWIDAHYTALKYTSCRGGKCAVSKKVECNKICSGRRRRINCATSYCKPPYGPMILKEIAMMA